MSTWTADQWAGFIAFAVAGCAGLALIAVWIYRRRVIAAEMAIIHTRFETPAGIIEFRDVTEAEMALFKQRWTAAMDGDNHTLALINDTLHVDPTAELVELAEHLAAGPGSLTTLREVGPGRIVTADPPVDPEVARWFAEAFDRPAHVPGRDEARELDEGGVMTRFQLAIEAPMRKAHLWELRGHAEHGGLASRWAELDRWRINTPTGEYPIVTARAEHTVDLTARRTSLLGLVSA